MENRTGLRGKRWVFQNCPDQPYGIAGRSEGRGEQMIPVCSEKFREIDYLCCQLLLFVETARASESQGEGGILAYGFVSECASMIEAAAQKRRQLLAQAQLEKAIGEDTRNLNSIEFQLNSHLFANSGKEGIG